MSRRPSRKAAAPRSPSTVGTAERRSQADRRSAGEDRRAFWRPTPDRRREAQELGRRKGDANE